MIFTEENISDLNVLADYLCCREIERLHPEDLKKAIGVDQADVLILYGGSIAAGIDEFADAIRNNAAKRYVISGGWGHTSETLRKTLQDLYPDLEIAEGSEAEMMAQVLEARYGLKPDLVEKRSTNCGNNVTEVLRLMDENGIQAKNAAVIQDASMIRRMKAGFEKYRPALRIVPFAAFQNSFTIREGRPELLNHPAGMWEPERFISLLMGEIPRLRDDAEGYGPNGRGFIDHVDVPETVLEAWSRLQEQFPVLVRTANPAYRKMEEKINAKEAKNLQEEIS